MTIHKKTFKCIHKLLKFPETLVIKFIDKTNTNLEGMEKKRSKSLQYSSHALYLPKINLSLITIERFMLTLTLKVYRPPPKI